MIAIPAIGLVSWQPGGDGRPVRSGLAYGALAGIGFGLLFVALDRAGTHARERGRPCPGRRSGCASSDPSRPDG